MKKIQLLFTAVLTLLAAHSNAQCGLIQINPLASTGSFNYRGQGSWFHWACIGDTVIGEGGGLATVYLERGAYADIQEGGMHTIWARNGSTVRLSGGSGGSIIYHEPGARVILDSLSNFTNQIIRCNLINFDSSRHPSPPCPVAQNTTLRDLISSCYFNFSNQLVLGVTNLNQNVSIFNLLGERIYQGTITNYNNVIDLSNTCAGVYVVVVGNQVVKVKKP